MKTLTTNQIDTITEAAYDADVELRSYSGRAMFGSQCIGVSSDSESGAALFLVAVAKEDADLAESLARNLRSDSLGRGIITYFPSFASVVDEDDEDEDDE